jgi:hypothetical protein
MPRIPKASAGQLGVTEWSKSLLSWVGVGLLMSSSDGQKEHHLDFQKRPRQNGGSFRFRVFRKATRYRLGVEVWSDPLHNLLKSNSENALPSSLRRCFCWLASVPSANGHAICSHIFILSRL